MTYAARPMGDYKTYGYAGDPGWLSSIWKVVKKPLRTVVGGLVGGPVGAFIAGAAGGAAGTKAATPALTMGMTGLPAGTIGGALTMPGGTRLSVAGVLPSHAAIGEHMPSGYHLRKDKRLPAKWVRNRRMNIANPRALRKAMRRVQGFEKLAKRTISFTRRVKMKK